MSNPRRGEVDVELDGTVYVLVYGHNELSAIEAVFGDRSIDDIFFSGSIPRRAILEAIRIGFEKRNRSITPKKAGRLIDRTMDAAENDGEGGADIAYARIVREVVAGLLAANGSSQKEIDRYKAGIDGKIEDHLTDDDRGSAKAEKDDAPPPVVALETGTD